MLSSIANIYERLVMECIREILEDGALAADQDYADDLACIALNSLPPKYVRHAVDFAAHLDDESHKTLRIEAADAVGKALETMSRRSSTR
ncbi:late competence development ComFB family protein [Thiorhodococcus mannitoliphagus]|uniref:Late competence development ComFB family protein n=1 Tax=Thiorhodococcus mannitoliphagus TaxID=329406 RepID=A0A6P1DVL1_9GAMM|nr:late competence development ComFB family protein [Thiorhodococcus mannitoliphagus]NEX20112.1 late competence development ComFB family protein [Thiorhodococcus mannitoliphagus]